MRNLLMIIAVLLMSWLSNARAQSLTVDPETIVPPPDAFDMEAPAPSFGRPHQFELLPIY